MGLQEDFKLKLASYKKKDKIRRNMLIMIAKSKENSAEEIVKAIEYYRLQSNYAEQINDLISNLSEKSKTYKQLFEKEKEINKNKKVKIQKQIKIKNSLNNVLEKIPFPPSYLLFEIKDKNEYKKQNQEFFNLENEKIRKNLFKNFNQKNLNFKTKISKYFPSNISNKKPINEIIFKEKNDIKDNSIESVLKKMFKPLICFYCGRRFDKNKEDEFKFNCHLKNHENEIKESLNFEDYKNRKIRDFFPQIKTFQTRFKNVDLYLPSLDDFDFKDEKIFVENRESIFCSKCGKSVCFKKDGQKFLIIDAKKVGLNVFAHKHCL